ncbi:MAG TPA: hypothetical protein VJX67_06250 [Blastocatellia bacterium]|nr:hypothetical protein [Blastocatellia bacterium]
MFLSVFGRVARGVGTRLRSAMVLALALLLITGLAPLPAGMRILGARPAPARQASSATQDASALEATQEVLGSVSRLRELNILQPVKSGVKTHDEIEQSVILDLDENTPREELEASAKTLAKFGLVPAGFPLRDYEVKLLREQVAGYYEPKTKMFYLASWIPASEQKTVMAHELTHALQDQHFNLRRLDHWPRGDSDAELAAHSLVEGEATVIMMMYSAEQAGYKLDVRHLGPLTASMQKEMQETDSDKYPVLSGAPLILREGLQFPYVYGIGFVQEVLKERSWAALDAGYSRLPASTKQIMHPDRFLTHDDPVKIAITELGPALGRGWKRIDWDVNGEFGYLMVLSQFIGRGPASAAAQGWSGDQYVLYENERGGLVLAQFTSWEGAAEARRFFEAYSARTQARYKVDGPVRNTATARTYKTDEGLVQIEIRDNDVIVVEGAESGDQLAKVVDSVWKSKKAIPATAVQKL